MSRPPELHRKMRPAAAFVMLGGSGLRIVEAQLDALLQRDIAEDVHALRVAVRHLRAVTWAFGPILPRAVMERWKLALHDVADAASAVRDWDVFLSETLLPALAMQPGDPVLVALIDVAHARRAEARTLMVTQLTRYRQAPLPTLYRDLLHLSDPKTRHGQHGRMAAFARGRIRKARGRVRGLARVARDGQIAHVHALRIGNKRLRYAIEALSDVLPKRYRKRLHGKLIARQTELGGIIDDAVAHRLICECLAS